MLSFTEVQSLDLPAVDSIRQKALSGDQQATEAYICYALWRAISNHRGLSLLECATTYHQILQVIEIHPEQPANAV